MTSQTQGIQQLLAAEKRAAEKVTEARKRKSLGISLFNIPSTPPPFSHLPREGPSPEAGQGGGPGRD